MSRIRVAGLVLGLIGALGATRPLEALVFGVSAAGLATLVAATVPLTTVAVASHLVPIRRALRVSPIEALRQE